MKGGGNASDLVSQIKAELDQIIDPCSAGIGKPVGIVGMGLIKDLTLEDGPDGIEVKILLRLTSPCCMMAPSFAQQADKRLKSMSQIAGVEVEVDPTIDWTPSMMSQTYRESLDMPSFMRGIEAL